METLQIEALEAGLGARRFYRVQLPHGRPARLIARLEVAEDPRLRPPNIPPEPPLEPLRSFLEARGLPVPRSFGSDPERGIELLEDLGERSLESVARGAAAAERRALYAEACRIPPALQRLDAPATEIAAFGRRLDRALFQYKAEQWIRWGQPACAGRASTPVEAGVVREAFEAVADACLAGPQRLAHRDFKAANLHLRAGARPGKRLVLIDLQGAFLAPPEYDLMCLLRDSQVPLPAAESAALFEAARAQLPDATDSDTAWRRFDLLSLSRIAKDLSRYVYAARERNDRRYLRHTADAWRALRAATAQSAGVDPRLARFWELLQELPEPACAP